MQQRNTSMSKSYKARRDLTFAVLLSIAPLFCWGFAGCGTKEDVKPAPTWENNFSAFLTTLQKVTRDSRTQGSGDVDITAVNATFLNKSVTWEGTLKYVHKGRPYFVEAFVSVGETTKLAAVMYYPDPDEVARWEKKEPGSKVKYTGIIKAVHIETVASKEPFPFVDLRSVEAIE